MTTRRPISWFLTENGRRLSYVLVTSTGIGLATARYAPHTFFLNYYKDFVQHYSNGKSVDLPKEVNDRYKKCLDLLNLSEVHRRLIVPFSVFGYDLFHAGSTNSKFGVIVGIPVNFTYKNIDDMKKDNIQVNQKNIDWSSETGIKLADALMLPEKVQEFAICREILMTKNNKIIYESIYPFLCIFFAYNLSQYLNKRLNLYAAPTALRTVLYSIVGVFSLGSYFLLKDMTEVKYETEVDKKLCELGPEYIESGVIFYDKLLKRNQALRELMGREGERKYSKLGNENFGIRQPRLALIHRKQFFDQKLKEITQNSNERDENQEPNV
ncbi:hypothetical protein K1T71_008724 [Dendrolimus kikuchii]|uniref:Uncharacterized protein n=1 Tax=Dendrolimus kikuchii TaxID=765133 RepID=A0ACC1CVR8_9NEOP|nr:hypothetical protein K1T71_008724 [Dendrolimus kikuchii]